MKIQVAKSDLEFSLQVASIGVGSGGSDLSTHYLFRIKDDKVEILAYNQRINASMPLKCKHEGDDGDAFTIEAWRLDRWLGALGDVAVEMADDSGEVTLASPRSTIRAKSLDPSKFPFWDKTLKEAKSVTTVEGDRLASALGYAKHFISDKDTHRPEIAQTESIKGSLYSTDKKAVTLITLEGFEDSGLRIHGKDIPSVLKFLSLKETDDVEILEHERAAFLKRRDGAIFGATRPITDFPNLSFPKVPDDAWWEITADDLKTGVKLLSASADKENTRVRFSFDEKNSKVVMSVKSAAGGEDKYPIPCTAQENCDTLPETGFEVDYPYLEKIVDHFSSDSLKFGINQGKKGKKGGYVRFTHGDDKDTYLTVVVWRL
jgi:DNA polymerase III sliding clamp (beta) subunit (PCNA family)